MSYFISEKEWFQYWNSIHSLSNSIHEYSNREIRK